MVQNLMQIFIARVQQRMDETEKGHTHMFENELNKQ
jgi:hypothetical protein